MFAVGLSDAERLALSMLSSQGPPIRIDTEFVQSPLPAETSADCRTRPEGPQLFEPSRTALGLRYEWMGVRKQKLLSVKDRRIGSGDVIRATDLASTNVAGRGCEERRKRRLEVLVQKKANALTGIQLDHVEALVSDVECLSHSSERGRRTRNHADQRHMVIAEPANVLSPVRRLQACIGLGEGRHGLPTVSRKGPHYGPPWTMTHTPHRRSRRRWARDVPVHANGTLGLTPPP